MVILTDLSDVLVRGVNGLNEVVTKHYDAETANRFMRRFAESNLDFCELMRGRMTEDEYCRILLRTNHWPFGVQEVKQFFTENIKKSIPDTLDVYRSIVASPRSLKHASEIVFGEAPEIHIVSDYILERIEEVKSYHPDLFCSVTREFWSCEIGKLKKDERFFKQLLWVIDVPADELILVDDNMYNTTAARLAGITSIHFNNAKQLKKTMVEYGFHFSK